MGEIKPSPTIYINNLNEKTAVDVVKEEIEAMFAQFGDVLQVTVMKGRLPNGHYRKGQAWVLFDSIEAASAAKEKMQSFSYHGKEMRIEFSANKSDLLAKRDGTFQPRPKRKYVAPAPGASSDGGDGEDAGGGGAQRGGAARMDTEEDGDGGDGGAGARPAAGEPAASKRKVSANAANPPHKILFLEHLPPGTEKDALEALFKQHAGYRGVRLVPARGLAFVEYTAAAAAGAAREQLNGYALVPGCPMAVNFSKQ
jgi:RNA recognition motif-containing protein